MSIDPMSFIILDVRSGWPGLDQRIAPVDAVRTMSPTYREYATTDLIQSRFRFHHEASTRESSSAA